jgi:hypothetical protein
LTEAGVFYADEKFVPSIWAHIEQLKQYFENIAAADNLIVFDRNYSFSDDQKFSEASRKHARNQQEMSLFWRLHVLTWCAKQALSVSGDFVECGVFHGYSSAVICDYLDFQTLNRTYYLYDTFEGLPEATSSAHERSQWNAYYRNEENSAAYVNVCRRFSAYHNVRVVKGVVPDSFADASPEQIAFLHLDMNAVRAEMMALDVLYDRISPNGMIVLDDFGWVANRPQMLAERDFFAARGKSVLELPTGQGIVIK